MKYRLGNIGLIVLSMLLIATVVIGGFLWWQKRCGAWPFWDPNVRCELGVRIVSQKTSPLTWEECIKIPGAMMQTSYPGVCSTPDGRQVTQILSDEEKKKLVPPTEQINEEKNWHLYQSAKGGFLIKYPPGWKVFEKINQISLNRASETLLITWGKTLPEPNNPSMFNEDIYSQAGIIHLAEFFNDDTSISEWKSNKLMLKGGDYFTESEMKYTFFASFETKNSGEISKILSTFKFISPSEEKPLEQGVSQKTSGPCSKDKDCAPGYKCWVPNCDAVKDKPGGDDCYITAPSCTKAF